jgi:hypothetical protein
MRSILGRNRRHHLLGVALGAAVLGPLLAMPSGALAERRDDPEQKTDYPGLRKPFERFDGTITLRTRDGQLRRLRVVIRNWIIDRGQVISRMPESGFMIVQLRGGEVVTVIDGKRQERLEDEFWTVAAGSAMTVETGKESAILQTTVVTDE